MPIILFFCLIAAFYTFKHGDAATMSVFSNYIINKYNYIQPTSVDWYNMAKPAYQYKQNFYSMIPVDTLKPLFIHGPSTIDVMSTQEKFLFIRDYIIPNTNLSFEQFVFIDKSGYLGIDLNLVKYGAHRYCAAFGQADRYYTIAQRLGSIFIFSYEEHIIKPLFLEFINQGSPLNPDFTQYNEMLATKKWF